MMDFTNKMEPYLPSMKLDYDAGIPLETEYMYRRPLQAAHAEGAELPLICAVCEQLEFLDTRRRKT